VTTQQPKGPQQARRKLLLADQGQPGTSHAGTKQQQDAPARGRTAARSSADAEHTAGAIRSRTRSHSAAARLADAAATSAAVQQQKQKQQPAAAGGSPGSAAAPAAAQQRPQQQQQQKGGLRSLRDVLDGMRLREEGEVQPRGDEALLVVGEAVLTVQGDCLAIQQQMEHITRQLGELLQQSKKQQVTLGPQQRPAADGAATEGLCSSVARLQEQVGTMQQTVNEVGAFMQQAGFSEAGAAARLKAALNEGCEASMKVSNLGTAHGVLQARANGHDSELQRLNDKIARLEQQQQQQRDPRAPEGAEIVVWAPADSGMADQIATTLTAAARLSQGSVQYVACRFQRRSSGGGNRDSSSPGGDGGGASSSAAAAAAAAGGGSRNKEPLALYVVRLASPSLVPTVLGGRTRLFLRQQGAPMWLDRVLTPEERRVRKQLQSVARELRAKGVQTRWCGHVLEEKQRRAAGRYQWVQVPPPPPLPSSPPPPPPSSSRGLTATNGRVTAVGAS
jgi:hypothetical protein